MTTIHRQRASAVLATAAPAQLLPAGSARTPHANVSAGPFNVYPEAIDRAKHAPAGAWLTALLVVYPVFATVAVVALGLLLSGTSL